MSDAMSSPPRLIGFTGAAQSGKSTAAAYVAGTCGHQPASFAGALKAMLRALLAYRGVDAATIERMIEGDLKEVPARELGGRTPRHAMQTLGTEWGRALIHPDLWVDAEMDSVGERRAVFADVRFENEARVIRERGGVVVRILRPDAPAIATAGHASEHQEVPADAEVVNDGDKVRLVDQVDRVVLG